MHKEALIEDYMTLCPHTIGLDQDVGLARKLMHRYKIRHLPVQSGGKLVGIVSDRDIKFAAAWSKRPENELNISDVYIPEPYVVNPETPLAEALTKMEKDRIGCALVQVSEKVVGIFTTTDACRALAELLRKHELCNDK